MASRNRLAREKKAGSKRTKQFPFTVSVGAGHVNAVEKLLSEERPNKQSLKGRFEKVLFPFGGRVHCELESDAVLLKMYLIALEALR